VTAAPAEPSQAQIRLKTRSIRCLGQQVLRIDILNVEPRYA
jgi:hypothetical protein